MSLTEFDEEIAIRGWREDGIEEGKILGKQEKAIETARKLLKDGRYTEQEISELLNIPIESFVTESTY